MTAFKNGAEAAVGSGKAVLGDPRIALTWLVNEAARYGGGVQAGQFVTTGTCIIPVAIAPGDAIAVDYGVLGTLSVADRVTAPATAAEAAARPSTGGLNRSVRRLRRVVVEAEAARGHLEAAADLPGIGAFAASCRVPQVES